MMDDAGRERNSADCSDQPRCRFYARRPSHRRDSTLIAIPRLDGLAASKIAESLSVQPSSLSFHLKELTHAGLIVPRQAGRFVIYAVNFDTMNALLGFLSENCCSGNPCSPVTSVGCETAAAR